MARNIDLARLRDAFDARGDIDAIAVDVVRFHDDVAEIDADAILDPRLLRKRGVATNEILLNDDAAPNGLDGAVEDCDEAVAGRLDQTSMVLGDAGLDEIPLYPLDADVRTFFVGLHQAAIGRNVADDDRCEATRHPAAQRRLALIPRFEVANFTHRGAPPTCKRRRARQLPGSPRTRRGYHIEASGQIRWV